MASLPGITRGVVLDMASSLGLQIREGRYHPAFLYEADECFLTGSGIGILPVQAIDGHSFPKQTARSRVAVHSKTLRPTPAKPLSPDYK